MEERMGRWEGAVIRPGVWGEVADPSPVLLLDKGKLAQIRVAKISNVIQVLKQEIAIFELEERLLREEYGFK